MNVEGLTRENVASHLQKWRLQLKKDGKDLPPSADVVQDKGRAGSTRGKLSNGARPADA